MIYATGFSPVNPRPVAGNLTLHKPYHPEQIVEGIREVTAGRPHPID
ncbi:hypothetical protein [Bradyrhizobium sp. CCBAU 65884]|nr:hypothetical protein [Bradyrhizobium sp. CCBAU 65884]